MLQAPMQRKVNACKLTLKQKLLWKFDDFGSPVEGGVHIGTPKKDMPTRPLGCVNISTAAF